jgi:hypothetical protein
LPTWLVPVRLPLSGWAGDEEFQPGRDSAYKSWKERTVFFLWDKLGTDKRNDM